MNELFLHYVWQYRLLKSELFTTDGTSVEIVRAGERNTDSGADFFDARIKIGETLWAGNVEIHKKSSDWNLHKHEGDGAYNNVILHVVYENDQEIKKQNGETIPTLELKGRILEHVLSNYREIFASKNTILCSKNLSAVTSFSITNMQERLAVARLERKSEEVKQYFTYTKNSWEDTFYWLLARYFGSSVNALPFELLAKSLSLQILAKHKDNRLQIESLLFGQAGMLEWDFEDNYPKQLKKEYDFLRKKYQLTPIDRHLWKFLRLRPSNFPTVRISQFADLICRSSHLFSVLLETKEVSKLFSYFELSVSEYWETHYSFDKESLKRRKTVGKLFANVILINVLVPILFEYGTQHSQEEYRERALHILENLPPEKNHIIEEWHSVGIKSDNALQTQALLELYQNYCKKKQCLSCGIGFQLLNRKTD